MLQAEEDAAQGSHVVSLLREGSPAREHAKATADRRSFVQVRPPAAAGPTDQDEEALEAPSAADIVTSHKIRFQESRPPSRRELRRLRVRTDCMRASVQSRTVA